MESLVIRVVVNVKIPIPMCGWSLASGVEVPVKPLRFVFEILDSVRHRLHSPFLEQEVALFTVDRL